MSLIFMESCDNQALVGAKWSSLVGVTNFNQSIGGKECWQLGGLSERLQSADFGAKESDTIIVGWRARFETVISNSAEKLTFWEGLTATKHLYIQTDSSGTIMVKRGNGTTLASSSAGVILQDVWMYLEAKVVIHDSAGSVIVRIDGVEVINASGLDTKNGGSDGLIDRVSWGEGMNGSYYRDIVVMNDSGSSLNDLLGPVLVESVLPDGAGNYTEWTPNSGANYAAVDDPNSPDSDTTYVEASSAGLRDSYTFENLSAITEDPLAVQLTIDARYNAAPLQVAGFLRRSATNDDGTAGNPSGGYLATVAEIWETDPIAAGAWTLANFNSTEFGVISS